MRLPALVLIALLPFCSCERAQEKDSPLLVLDSLASCPYITTDQEGRIAVSYVSAVNDSQSVFRYRISADGRTFSEPVEILGSQNIKPHGENLPKIIFPADGSVLAVWGSESNDPRNRYAGIIFYSQSFDEGRSWQPVRRLVLDTTSYDQRYFDLALRKDGDVAIIWLDNRGNTDQEGSSVYFSRTAGRRGFTGERRINESICPCCRTRLFIDKEGNVHVCFRDIINDSIRDMVHMMSTDNGKTFSPPRRISHDNWVMNGCPHTGPAMTETGRGLHFSWYTGGEPAGVYFCSSYDGGQTFTSRDSVSGRSSAKHPQVSVLTGDRIAIAWDETVRWGEAYNSRIGLQIRDTVGRIQSTEFISDDQEISEFPVLENFDGGLFVAFTQRKDGKTRVVYRFLRR